MSAEMTVVGNLTATPELRYTSSGTPVASFTVADTPRVKDGSGWKDGETLFQRCEVWRELAEHVAQSLDKGTRVLAKGRVKTAAWTGQDGEQRSPAVLEVDAIGPELRWATATVQRVRRASAPAAADAPWESGDGLVVGEPASRKQTFLNAVADGGSGAAVVTSAKDELARDHGSES